MNKRLFLLLGAAFFFIQFVFFSYLVDKNIFKKIDFDTTVRLQDNISRRFDDMFSIFSEIGKFEVSVIVLVVVFLVFRKFLAGFIGLFLFGLFHVIELLGKYQVENLPPPQFLLRTKHLVDFPQFHVRSEYSYPSGHSGRAVFISVILLIFIWRIKMPLWIKITLSAVIVGYDITMFVSRIYLGEHWMTDVVGGGMLGLSFALLTGVLLVGKSKLKLSPKMPQLPKFKISIKRVE